MKKNTSVTLFEDSSIFLGFVLLFIWFYGCESCGADTKALGPVVIEYLEPTAPPPARGEEE